MDDGGDLGNKNLAYYFRQSFKVSKESKKPFLIANVVRDDGVIVYLNGTKVITDNMPTDNITYLTPATGTAAPNGGPNDEKNPKRFLIDGDLLEVGTNVIAAQVHQIHGQSSDVAFQLELLASDANPKNYIKELITGINGETILESAMKILPSSIRDSSLTSLNLYLNKIESEETNSLLDEDALTSIFIAQKLKDQSRLNELIDVKLNLISDNSNFTSRAEILHLKRNQLIQSGATKAEIDRIQKSIASPPRNPNLSNKLLDLSEHYTASMFNYKGWWGGNKHDDLRTLPDQYDSDIPFDLRGIIQLNSGKNDKNKSLNEHWSITNKQITYPNEVKEIKVNVKGQKIHFLMGLLFGWNIIEGNRAAELTINYEDGSKELIPILGKVDVFDYWDHDSIAKLTDDKIGWEGTCIEGNRRALTKYSWENPHTDKTISHIDFKSALDNAAPFIVAITIEE